MQSVAYSSEEEPEDAVPPDALQQLTGLEEVPTLAAVPHPHKPRAKGSPFGRAVHDHPTAALILAAGLTVGGTVLAKHFLGGNKPPQRSPPKPAPQLSSGLPAAPKPKRAIPRARCDSSTTAAQHPAVCRALSLSLLANH